MDIERQDKFQHGDSWFKVTELELQNIILNWLNLNGFFAWRNQSQGTYDPIKKIYRKKVGFDIKGVSDILGIEKSTGRLIAIEVKSDKGKLSSEQGTFLDKIKSHNGLAFVTWPSDWEAKKCLYLIGPEQLKAKS